MLYQTVSIYKHFTKRYLHITVLLSLSLFTYDLNSVKQFIFCIGKNLIYSEKILFIPAFLLFSFTTPIKSYFLVLTYYINGNNFKEFVIHTILIISSC